MKNKDKEQGSPGETPLNTDEMLEGLPEEVQTAAKRTFARMDGFAERLDRFVEEHKVSFEALRRALNQSVEERDGDGPILTGSELSFLIEVLELSFEESNTPYQDRTAITSFILTSLISDVLGSD